MLGQCRWTRTGWNLRRRLGEALVFVLTPARTEIDQVEQVYLRAVSEQPSGGRIVKVLAWERLDEDDEEDMYVLGRLETLTDVTGLSIQS